MQLAIYTLKRNLFPGAGKLGYKYAFVAEGWHELWMRKVWFILGIASSNVGLYGQELFFWVSALLTFFKVLGIILEQFPLNFLHSAQSLCLPYLCSATQKISSVLLCPVTGTHPGGVYQYIPARNKHDF